MADRYFPEQHALRGRVVIFAEQDRAIEEVLAELVTEIPAHLVLLTDTGGQLVSLRGDRTNVDPVALGALVAGELAASQEIGRLTGEYQDYQLIIREGQQANLFIAEAGPYLVMLVKVPHGVPLGWARMLILRAARRLAEIVTQPPPEAEPEQALAPEEESDLAELIGDALDELWTE